MFIIVISNIGATFLSLIIAGDVRLGAAFLSLIASDLRLGATLITSNLRGLRVLGNIVNVVPIILSIYIYKSLACRLVIVTKGLIIIMLSRYDARL